MNEQTLPGTPPDGDSGLRYGPGPHPADGPGVAGFVVALLTGVPVALMTTYWLLGSLIDGTLPGIFSLLLWATSSTGSVLALVGMRSRPRRFKKTALLLTIPTAVVFVVGVVLLVALVVVLAAGGTR